MKMTPIGWEKVFLNNLPDKELIYKIYKELVKLNIKKHPKINNYVKKKWAEYLKRHFQLTLITNTLETVSKPQ